MEPESLLKGIHALIIKYRAEKQYGDNEFARLAKLPNTAFVPIESEKTTARGKVRTIDLMTLLKIFNAYPQLKERVIAYLTGGSKENGTSEIKTAALHDDLYKTALEAILERDNEIRRLKQELSGSKGKRAKK